MQFLSFPLHTFSVLPAQFVQEPIVFFFEKSLYLAISPAKK